MILSLIASVDYQPPVGPFVIPASGNRIVCLSFVIESDNLFENAETLTGFLRGIVLSSGDVDPNPPRITFQTRETTIEITDDRNDGECFAYNLLYKSAAIVIYSAVWVNVKTLGGI